MTREEQQVPEQPVALLRQKDDDLCACREQLQSVSQELEETQRSLETVIERSNQMALESAIAEIELNQIFNTSPDGMWVIDENSRVQRINTALLKLLGTKAEDAVGHCCSELLALTGCGTPDCPMTQILSGKERVECDTEKLNADGSRTPFILTATPFRGLGGELIGIVVALKDNTERKRAEAALQQANETLERLAASDGLTQLANRRRFDESLLQEWRRMSRERAPLGLIICDIDHFKRYNDTFGHQQGDDCLRAVARAIGGSARRPADLVARYGGEEFALILPNTHAEGALHLAETIRSAVCGLEIPHPDSSAGPFVTLSLGVACIIPSATASPEALLSAADQALYAAKGQGRNRSLFLHL